MTTLQPPPPNSVPPPPLLQVHAAASLLPLHLHLHLLPGRRQAQPLMPFATEAAATQVAGSKRPSGNDLFREMVMSGSVPATSSSLPSLAKRQSVDDGGSSGSVDWQQLITHENRVYFLHVPTGRGQWNRPALLAKAQEAVGADAGVSARSSAAAAAGDAAVGAAAEDPATYNYACVFLRCKVV